MTVRVRRGVCVVAVCVVALTVAGAPLAVPSAAAGLPQVVQQLSGGQQCATPSGIPVTGPAWPGLSSDLDRAWTLSQGASVTVAVLDTGVAARGVPGLAGQVTFGTPSAGTDCVGHGTFVAGLVAGRQDATGSSGVAPLAHVLSVAVTDGSGNTTADRIAAGIDAAVAARAPVIDVSVGTPTPSPGLRQAVTNAIAAGAVVIAPATLDGQQQDGPVYPAAYPDVLSVADVGVGAGVLPGAAVTGSPVDVAAPGDGVISAGVGGGAVTADGASYAAAFVAGTAALVDSYLGPVPPAELIRRLENTAVHPGTALPDPQVGFGTVDPFAALSTVDDLGGRPPAAARGGRMVVPAPPSRAASRTAAVVAAAAVGLVFLVAFVLLSLAARGRRSAGR